MKGHIFMLLEEFVTEVASEEVLYDAFEDCSFDTNTAFVRTENYPDEHLIELVDIVINKIGITLAQAHFSFGKWLYPRLSGLLPKHFTDYTHPAYVLQQLDDLHHIELKKLYLDALPPKFQYNTLSLFEAQLIYTSSRRMFDLVEGVLAGMAEYYGVQITVTKQLNWHENPNSAKYLITYANGVEL
ncbi:heme NO-binding domain-containing protein [Pseudoalteromonas luteoviolacea]|uniref:heme NO-binding domain-containing protein n=1 Tax=Pseudoalteromonas luteoviolacea TaxID=43657 RepID=UPI001B3644CB|nr:heme NO-binding domain-containing protein [Pseudoalteromonas luteoviolacea]MBQ4875749.1 heme NO-binding domain-containing protein [Pseudoalteromonas luteoviolacea]MBQ4904784.1 heme NO-binding domain-containing protein [Pseudoalteromonas luteoviolacea]